MVCTTALFPVTSETLTIKYENYEKLSCCFLENKVSTISSSCKDDPKIKISLHHLEFMINAVKHQKRLCEIGPQR